MSGKDNLITLSSEKAREFGAKGGKKSAQVRRKRKLLRETIEICLAAKPPQKINDDLKRSFPSLGKKGFDLQTAAVLSMIKIVLGGGKDAVSSFMALRDTIGEKPESVVGVKYPNIALVEFVGGENGNCQNSDSGDVSPTVDDGQTH